MSAANALPAADAAAWLRQDAAAMSEAVRSGQLGALALTDACLLRIAQTNPRLHAFTELVTMRARQRAAPGARRQAGADVPPPRPANNGISP